MKKNTEKHMQNREISWLRFNQRVLHLAKNKEIPLLERLKFIQIFTTNLDEFFMIRMGTLYNMKKQKPQHIDNKSGMTLKEEIVTILEKTRTLYQEKDTLYNELAKELKEEGIEEISISDTTEQEMQYLRKYFKSYIKPVLSPQIIDKHHPFPHLSNKELHYVAFLSLGKKKKFAMIPVPNSVPKVIFLEGQSIRYIRVEELVAHFAKGIFHGSEIIEGNIIRATRNEDINFGNEPTEREAYYENIVENDTDYRLEMKDLLHKRKRLAVVRLEFLEEMSQELEDYLSIKLKIKPNQMYTSKSPLVLSECNSLALKIGEKKRNLLLYKPYTAQNPKGIKLHKSIIKQVEDKDVLLSYPYESMEPFLQLIKEASMDKAVLSIKITIYRLASHPKLVDYLCRASENGIAVTVLIELRARFDESKNIYWSERLEASGCHLIYGVEEYKVHSKICLITRSVNGKIAYITQVGTGNYNESTAKIYTDLSLITANEEIGMDAVNFFQNMGMGNLKGKYQHLLIGPYEMKNSLLALIDEQILLGPKGYIGIKINGLADEVLMEKMKEASRAGVKIHLCVRGICCLLPGVSNVTENIEIHSVVGRFLEHSRIYIFGKGNGTKVYISSADWLHRNTDRRVEVAIPVYDKETKEKVMTIFNLSMKDNINGRKMLDTGEFISEISTNVEVCNSQEKMME